MTNPRDELQRLVDVVASAPSIDGERLPILIQLRTLQQRLGRVPSFEREPPHCPSCFCGMGEVVDEPAVEPGASRKLLLSDMADNLIRELRRQHFVTMQSVFDGMVLQIKPDRDRLPNGMITNAEKSSDAE